MSAPNSLKVKSLGLDAAREAAKKRVKDVQFKPIGPTDLNEPKFGKEDLNNEEHSGGNTWAGGVSTSILMDTDTDFSTKTGGRDTAGMGGRRGYMRLFKGNDIKQVKVRLMWPPRWSLNDHKVSDKLKDDVPDYIKERAREVAKVELAGRLEQLNMSIGEAKEYGMLLTEVQSHIASLHDLFESEVYYYYLCLNVMHAH